MTRMRVVYNDPTGARHAGLPTFPWRCAPDGLATVRQLRAAGLRPGGQDIAAQVLWRGIGGTRVAYLYQVENAKPKRCATPAQREAISAALEARRVCPSCHLIRPYYIPRKFGCCLTCAGLDPTPTGGRPRRRYRAGALLYGRCVRCHHRTYRRHHGQWLHDVCAQGPCPHCAPHTAVPVTWPDWTAVA